MSADLNFDRRVYHRRVPFSDVQLRSSLISVNFTRELFGNETISDSSINGESYASQFLFNKTSLIVYNLVPLSPGRYELAIIIVFNNQNLIVSSAVIDVLSPST